MVYVLYDINSLVVVDKFDTMPNYIHNASVANLAIARCENIPQGDILTVTNIQPKTEKYTVKEPKTVLVKDEATGEVHEETQYVEVEKEREYFTCELIGEKRVIKLSYEKLVEKYIREKYSINQELAILRQRDTKPLEFEEYFSYAESCKAKAKLEI